ncbi:hypothetical protein SLE2022_006830 [Rubroshorea leprosula]
MLPSTPFPLPLPLPLPLPRSCPLSPPRHRPLSCLPQSPTPLHLVRPQSLVNSFGILLLKLICWKLYLLVQEDEEAMEDINRVEKFVMIAICCIQDHPSLRPTMKRVSQMLEGTVEVSYPPANPHSSV